ncbi:MAG: TRAP transporter small permease [Pseudomonadota bacterium]
MQRAIETLARTLALLGGVTLTALIVLTCASVLGRSINSVLHSDAVQQAAPAVADALLATGVGPINGDYELVEAGMAFAIFAFLPLCHLRGAHASVDIFTASFSPAAKRRLLACIEVVFAAVLIVFAWQLLLGGMSKYRSGQTTFLLQFPVWWSYAASIGAALVAALVSVYTAVCRLHALRTGVTPAFEQVGNDA